MTVTTSYIWLQASPNTVLNTNTGGDQVDVSVARFGDGEWWGFWDNFDHITGRMMSANGIPLLPNENGIDTNSPAPTTMDQIDSATLAGGGMVVAYVDHDSGNGDIRFRRLYNDAPLPPFAFAHNSGGAEADPSVAALEDGGFIITWTTVADGAIRGRIFNPDGTPASGVLDLDTDGGASRSSVTGLAGGAFAVVYQDEGADPANSVIRLRIFDPGGDPVGPSVVLDSFGGINRDPKILALPGGGFVVAYADNGWGLGSTEITARVYAANGTPVSGYILANAGETELNQTEPTLALLPNGFWAVGWATGTTNDGRFAAFTEVGVAVGYIALIGGVLQMDLAGTASGLIVGWEAASGDGSGTAVRGLMADFVRTSFSDAAGDTIFGDGLRDSMAGNAGNDVLIGLGGADTLDGGADYDTLSGGAGNDILIGGIDNDILVGGAGADQLDGGDGFDRASYVDAAAGVSVNLATGVHAGEALGDQHFSIEVYVLSSFDDTFTAGAAAATVWGEYGEDALFGAGGDDFLSGGAGDDVLNGGAGADILQGDADFDTVSYAGAAAAVIIDLVLGAHAGDAAGDTFIEVEAFVLTGHGDTFHGTIDNEQVEGGGGADTLFGGDGHDLLIGGAQNDSLFGDDGDDVLRGGAGADGLTGGLGVDTADYSGAAAGMRAQLNTNASTNDGDGGTDTFSGIENLTGSAFNDVLIGDGLANVLRGGTGADTLLGLVGNDVLWGGAGALNTLQGGLGDDLYVLEAADSIVESVGEGTDTVDARINTYVLANNVENLTFGGPGNFAGTGNALANIITGGDGNDTLRGRGGVDVMHGGGGFDTADYTLAAAGVTARIDQQKATNDGDGATDTYTSIENLIGSNFNDTLIGDGNANVLMGGIGTDTLLGFAGDDTLIGGSGGGNNQMQGGQGDDYYVLDAFDTCVEFAGEGFDTVEARVGTYTLGNHIENLLYTGPGKFVGNGNALDNVITGGNLNDILRGKGGNDTIHGGLGNDEVQLRGVAANYTITAEGAGWRIVDSVAGRDGSTFVTSVEALRYADNTTTALTYPPPPPAPLEPVAKSDDAFVLPALPDGEPLILPGSEAFQLADEPPVLSGAEETAPLFLNLEAHVPFAGNWALTFAELDHRGGDGWT
ncbi:hypothetical protein [Brevundimonas sp.]|uniref:calcium-binding protein n=1 Tax=Brevundimonas sp. TaxID=1871086 RepID=UPI002D628F12|nr:hypothetical protein [Brevundimonas sp.]HYC98192.1 hypothetical protein [Brevundimonas sp.]